ncbi:MAG: zinc ABC transporter substrate-binding protein [Bacilli bacterium]|nr:zinc ABC transporter substrate-binding protein [Bacilli bacterium]
MKKILGLFLVLICLSGCSSNNSKDNITIISTSFPGYDFVRAITKDSNIEVKMLIKPGVEIHHFEPTPKDIINIESSNLFVYVGGDSDEWVSNLLKDMNKDKTIKLMDLVDLTNEELKEGMEGDNEVEYDEHVWTSPINVIKIINKLKDEIISIDSINKELYEKNANEYIKELYSIDSEIRNIVAMSNRKEIIFGDRFPIKYFTDEYNIDYYAAFKGCSHETEASAKTIAFLINKVKEDDIPVIFKVELSNGKIANTIGKETNTKVLEYNSAHNITMDDFNSGITYIDIMKKNIEVLKEALL